MTLSRRLFLGLCIAVSVPGFAIAADQQGVSTGEIVLGTHQDLSGPVTALGTSLRDGLTLAAD
jgi:hypothetical protein